MKRLFIEIVAFLLFLSGFFMLLEYLFRDYKNGVDYIMDDFHAEYHQAEVLLVGNSHTIPLYRSLKKEGRTSVACLTIVWDDLFWMQALVKNYVDEMPRLKYVILNCDDELLGFNQTLSGMQYMNRILYQYADTMYGNKLTDKLLSKSQFFRSNRDIGYLFNKQANKDMLITGMASGTGGFSDEECKARAVEISDRRFQRKLFRENISYVESLIAEVASRNAKLIILKMPKCDCLKESVVKSNLAASKQLLDSVFNARKVDVFDFTNDTLFKRNEFSNPDHLTIPAARKLLEKVNERFFELAGERPILLQEP